MPSVGSVGQGLLRELEIEEKALIAANNAYTAARNTAMVRLKKYAAVRDTVISYLGANPYIKDFEWYATAADGVSVSRRGRFRFSEMRIGDAAAMALGENPEPMSPLELVIALRDGGAEYLGVQINLRTINAALTNKTGVEKLDDGRFQLKPAEVDPDDMPFE